MPEGLIDAAVVQAARSLVEEQGSVGRAWSDLQSFANVLLKGSASGSAQGQPTSLSELAFGYVEALLGAVEVLQVQGQRLTDPDPRAV